MRLFPDFPVYRIVSQSSPVPITAKFGAAGSTAALCTGTVTAFAESCADSSVWGQMCIRDSPYIVQLYKLLILSIRSLDLLILK